MQSSFGEIFLSVWFFRKHLKQMCFFFCSKLWLCAHENCSTRAVESRMVLLLEEWFWFISEANTADVMVRWSTTVQSMFSVYKDISLTTAKKHATNQMLFVFSWVMCLIRASNWQCLLKSRIAATEEHVFVGLCSPHRSINSSVHCVCCK